MWSDYGAGLDGRRQPSSPAGGRVLRAGRPPGWCRGRDRRGDGQSGGVHRREPRPRCRRPGHRRLELRDVQLRVERLRVAGPSPPACRPAASSRPVRSRAFLIPSRSSPTTRPRSRSSWRSSARRVRCASTVSRWRAGHVGLQPRHPDRARDLGQRRPPGRLRRHRDHRRLTCPALAVLCKLGCGCRRLPSRCTASQVPVPGLDPRAGGSPSSPPLASAGGGFLRARPSTATAPDVGAVSRQPGRGELVRTLIVRWGCDSEGGGG